ncbi:hypothetical protein C2G38_2080010 [Gigaspora rosea]|uniref:Uncharacterized protein n=1 Tax=Gigaspora rosea TaxID=44941 RepID=A0A397VE86_9GLOM|nr:hypothetical protein C2G38_2080010 [Gigaspora rosea]
MNDNIQIDFANAITILSHADIQLSTNLTTFVFQLQNADLQNSNFNMQISQVYLSDTQILKVQIYYMSI